MVKHVNSTTQQQYNQNNYYISIELFHFFTVCQAISRLISRLCASISAFSQTTA